MFKTYFLVFFEMICISSFSQDLTNKRYIKTDSFKYEFYVSDRNLEDFHTRDSLMYYWCKAQKLIATQGGASGRLTNGNYLKFYHSGQLAEKGFFRMGLKHGIWKTWYMSGALRAIYQYKNGKRHGIFTLFDEQGSILDQRKYVNNKPKRKRLKIKDKSNSEEPKKRDENVKEISFWDRFKSKFNLKKRKN